MFLLLIKTRVLTDPKDALQGLCLKSAASGLEPLSIGRACPSECPQDPPTGWREAVLGLCEGGLEEPAPNRASSSSRGLPLPVSFRAFPSGPRVLCLREAKWRVISRCIGPQSQGDSPGFQSTSDPVSPSQCSRAHVGSPGGIKTILCLQS